MSTPSEKPPLLFLAHRLPYPPNKGDKIRSFNELLFLSQSYDVKLFCLYDSAQDGKHVEALKQYASRVEAVYLRKWQRIPALLAAFLTGRSLSVALFGSGRLRKLFRNTLKEFPSAPIFVFSGQMADYVPAIDLERCVLDFCDVDSHKWDNYADRLPSWKAWFFRLEAKRLFGFENAVALASRAALFITPSEQKLFESLGGGGNLSALSNGVDIEFFKPVRGHEEQGRILFTGAMDYFPNIEGVEWFAHAIFPHIKAKFSGARFVIAGSNPSSRVQALAAVPGVEITGFVEDMRTEQAKAHIVVVPLRIARGMQNKVLEAMACGKAVIVTRKSLGGIEVESGRELMVADTPEEFITAVESLLSTPALVKALGSSARAYLETHFSWSKNFESALLPLFKPRLKMD